jgi:nanoRNase/pAp phosphatase (c-di-AMP/oligoRNAs hydrolase)
MISEVVGALSEGEPFAIGWFERDGDAIVSLRSRYGGVDVSTIAKAYGGGGHAMAAGFRMPIAAWLREIGVTS